MKRTGYGNQQVYGEVLRERLNRSPHAGALKKEIQVFKAVQGEFTAACTVVTAALQQRDDALEAVNTTDGRLDKTLLSLANALVGADLGKRLNPFADYSRYTPAKLTGLAYAAEEKEVRVLLTALRKKPLPPAVTAAVKAVTVAVDAVAGALKGLGGPQADYEKAMQERDALLLDWNKALGRLKRAAAVAYDEDRAGYRALFAAVPTKLLQAPKRPRKRPATPSPATPSAP